MTKLTDIRSRVLSGEVTAEATIRQAFERAKAAKDFNAVLNLAENLAITRAIEVDEKIARGEKVGQLAGVPFLAKDSMLTFDTPTTASARMLEKFEAPFQSEAVERLEAEDAICIGKTNLDAFAHGGSTENSYFGPTKNPHDTSKVPGGSSGGSAAAVALDIVPFALGTDTGGSIRQPASFCGVVGFKPSYGAISRYGVVAMASSTDVIGPIATDVDDIELLCSIMYGQDAKDATTVPDFFVPHDSKQKLTIGLIEECFGDGVEHETKAALTQRIDELKAAGHSVESVSLPSVKHALAVYYIVVPAEISSNLARYDGIKYGHRAEDALNLNEVYAKSRSEGFMDENKRRILIGNYVLSSGYYDAYYKKAQTVRTLLVRDFQSALAKYDVLLSPVAPGTAFGMGERVEDPLSMYLADTMTVPASLAGLPAISIPIGKDLEGLPIGLQLTAGYKDDAALLGAAKTVMEVVNG